MKPTGPSRGEARRGTVRLPEVGPLWHWLLPELRRFPQHEQAPALAEARGTALDLPERLGMIVGLVAVTALTRQALDDAGMASRFAALLANVVVAVPLLALFLGPFHLRRLRRGLRAQRARRGDQA